MKCKICGHENLPEARFCAGCGAVLVTEAGPPAAPAAPRRTEPPPVLTEITGEYAGFWIRFAAAIIDSLILWVISSVLSFSFIRGLIGFFPLYSSVPFIFPLLWLYNWLFTGLTGQTLGKMVLSIKVFNTEGNKPGLGTAALREIVGKTISTLVIYLGFLWIAFDMKKEGWHDKIAGTCVVKVVKRERKESEEAEL